MCVVGLDAAITLSVMPLAHERSDDAFGSSFGWHFHPME